MPSGGHNKIRSPAVDALAIELFSEGKTLKEVASAIGVSLTALRAWRLEDGDFDKACTRAQEIGFEVDADSLKNIADEYPDVQKARLKSDNLKWLLARKVPHKYGDRLDVNLTQTIDISGNLMAARQRALLPPRYHTREAEEQHGVITHELDNELTGLEPVAPQKPQEDQDDDPFS